MTDANTISVANAGVDPSNGKILPWRKVNFLREAQIGDLETVADGTAEGPNTSGSLYDQTTTLAKILTRRYQGYDVFDLLALNYELNKKIAEKLGIET